MRYAAEHRTPWVAPEEFGFSSHRRFRFGRALKSYAGGVWMLIERMDDGSEPYRFLAHFEKYYGYWSYQPPDRGEPAPPEALALLDEALR